MPDHFHGILQIMDVTDTRRGGSRPALTEVGCEPLKIKPLGQIIGAFKTVSSKKINLCRSTPGVHVWQRNYYDHIIRDEVEMGEIWDYITANPYHDSQEHDPARTHPNDDLDH
jgi:putative transposase